MCAEACPPDCDCKSIGRIGGSGSNARRWRPTLLEVYRRKSAFALPRPARAVYIPKVEADLFWCSLAVGHCGASQARARRGRAPSAPRQPRGPAHSAGGHGFGQVLSPSLVGALSGVAAARLPVRRRSCQHRRADGARGAPRPRPGTAEYPALRGPGAGRAGSAPSPPGPRLGLRPPAARRTSEAHAQRCDPPSVEWVGRAPRCGTPAPRAACGRGSLRADSQQRSAPSLHAPGHPRARLLRCGGLPVKGQGCGGRQPGAPVDLRRVGGRLRRAELGGAAPPLTGRVPRVTSRALRATSVFLLPPASTSQPLPRAPLWRRSLVECRSARPCHLRMRRALEANNAAAQPSLLPVTPRLPIVAPVPCSRHSPRPALERTSQSAQSRRADLFLGDLAALLIGLLPWASARACKDVL